MHRQVIFERTLHSCAEQLGKRMESALPDIFRSDVRSYVAHLDMLRGATAETFYEASVVVPELRFDTQLERLLKVSNFDKGAAEEREALVEAYQSLVFCAVEARQLFSNPHVEQIDPRNDRLPLAVLRGVLSDYEDDRPAAFFAHIIQFYVVLLHFNVVRERTVRRDANNRFIFAIGEDGLEQVTTKGVFPGV